MLSMALLVPNIAFAKAGSDKEAEEYARYAWDDSGSMNMSVDYIEGAKLEAEYEKTKLLQMRSGGAATYVRVNLSEELFPNNGEAKSVAITVRYYDEYEGAYFTIDYTGSSGARTPADRVIMTGDKEFKEHTFYIDECYFKNDNAGGDLLIATWTSAFGGSSGPVYLQWVEIKDSFPQMPVKAEITNGSLGNVFDIKDDKHLTVSVKNLTSDCELTVSGEYEILSYDKRVIDSGMLSAEKIAAKSAAQHDVKLDIAECGGYYIRTRLSYSGEYKGEKINGGSVGEDLHFSVISKLSSKEKPNPMMRTQIQFQFNDRAKDMKELYQMAADIGMSGIREYAMWNKNTAVAPYSEYVFKPAFDMTGQLKMTENMAVLLGHPAYGGELYIPTEPESIKAICDYAEWFVKEYGDTFTYLEIWNEPNVYGGFNINYATPEQYTELVKAVYTRIKPIKPDIKITAMSTATIHYSFIDAAIDAGILDYCDAISCHPYDWDTNADETGKDRIRNDVYRSRAQELRKKLDDLGYNDIEISWTELGVRSGKLWASETAQAAYLTQLMTMIQGDGVADNIYQFNFVNPGLDNDLRTGESHWGLLYDNKEQTGPYAAKLSYIAMAGYNKLLSDAIPVEKIIRDKTSIYRFRRNADGRDVAVLWSDNSCDNIALDLGTSEVETFDMYGNRTGTLIAADGKYSFTTTFEPMYVVGEFGGFTETEPIITIANARAYAAPSDRTAFTITDSLGRDLRIEADARDGIAIIENDGMENGQAVIRVETAHDAANENTLRLKLYDGDSCVFTARVHAIITEPMKLESFVEKIDGASARTEANVLITNLASENSFSGTVTADFTEYGGAVQTREFDNVRPKETVSVQLNIPESLVQRTFNFDAAVALDYGYSVVCPIRLTSVTAQYAYMPPPISGSFSYSDWQGGEFYAADRKNDVRYISDWSGSADCSVLGKLKWDDANLYLLAVVTDDVFYQPNSGANMWSGDGIQFGLCTDDDRRLAVGGSFSEFGLAKTPEGVQLFRFESLSAADKAMNVDTSTALPKNVLVTSCDCSVEEHDGKYIYRARIPWSEILPGVTTIEDHTSLGFSMLVNDNDGNGRGWLQFSDGIGQTKAANLYGSLSLKK